MHAILLVTVSVGPSVRPSIRWSLFPFFAFWSNLIVGKLYLLTDWLPQWFIELRARDLWQSGLSWFSSSYAIILSLKKVLLRLQIFIKIVVFVKKNQIKKKTKKKLFFNRQKRHFPHFLFFLSLLSVFIDLKKRMIFKFFEKKLWKLLYVQYE